MFTITPALSQALENRRAFFKEMGAKATDHAAVTPYTAELPPDQANAIFQRALKGDSNAADAQQFMGHMLMEMARMSIEDGLVMQLHPGSCRNHNPAIFAAFGADKGADIPRPGRVHPQPAAPAGEIWQRSRAWA